MQLQTVRHIHNHIRFVGNLFGPLPQGQEAGDAAGVANVTVIIMCARWENTDEAQRRAEGYTISTSQQCPQDPTKIIYSSESHKTYR